MFVYIRTFIENYSHVKLVPARTVEDLADFYEILDDFPSEHLIYTRTHSSKDAS